MINDRSFISGRKFCFCERPELIENYDKAIADETQTWDCHHRLETHNSDGERRLVDLSHKELIALDMYYNRPPEELIFLTVKEHHRLHNANPERNAKISEARKGKKLSEEHKAKLSEAHKGNKNALGKHHSEEAKKKMSEAHKGKKRQPHSEETKQKLSTMKKGKHWKLVDGKRVWY